jgi:hypothetical protein
VPCARSRALRLGPICLIAAASGPIASSSADGLVEQRIGDLADSLY